MTEKNTLPWLEKDAAALLQSLGRVGGWAPGYYTGRCFECKETFTGDKRASFCLPCAIANLTKSAAALHNLMKAAETVCSKIEEDCPNYWKSLWEVNVKLRSALNSAKGGE